jgi:hypothetical protein
MFAYAIAGEFESSIQFVMNLNSLEAGDWKISERLASLETAAGLRLRTCFASTIIPGAFLCRSLK